MPYLTQLVHDVFQDMQVKLPTCDLTSPIFFAPVAHKAAWEGNRKSYLTVLKTPYKNSEILIEYID